MNEFGTVNASRTVTVHGIFNTILYEIKDEISQLKNEIHDKDTETIQAIVKASVPATPIEDPNMAIMKAILPEVLKNPNSMKALMELSEAADKRKK